MSTWVVVDVESDGPLLGTNSMVCFGAVIVEPSLSKTFYSELIKPVSENYNPDALAVSGFTREQHENDGQNQIMVMSKFEDWLKENCKGQPVLVSDNNGYDASWINWYFHTYIGKNPFGWSSRRIGDMFCGFYNNPFYRWKKHRKTAHTHNPVDDAKGNAEALLYLVDRGFKLKM